MRHGKWSVTLALLLLLVGYANGQQTNRQTVERQVFQHPGQYISPGGKCKAVLATSSMGGFITLTIKRTSSNSPTVSDVTGIGWLNAETLIYTASPIYGTPGLYVYDCHFDHTTQILSARNHDNAYPEGRDYFELKSISHSSPVEIFFYYAPDVDRVDFTSFRTPHNLYQVELNGNGFRKAG